MLRRTRPDEHGRVAGEELAARGRARRFACEGGELHRLAPGDRDVAERLLGLGEARVGGFTLGGVDREGVWLFRESEGEPLAAIFRDKRVFAPEEALAAGLDLARALAACEAASLSPGPATPETIGWKAGRATLRAEPLVSALLGDAHASGTRGSESARSPLWTPPEQADGAPWDASANRYVLGLLLYRLIAGAHPFAGAGLRHALAQASQREPPPFEDAIAAALPSGLQSLVLRLLAPDRSARPRKTLPIAEALEQFAADEIAIPARQDRPRKRREEPRPEPPRARRRKRIAPSLEEAPPLARAAPARSPAERARALWPLAAGIAVAAGAVALLGPTPPPARPTAAHHFAGALDAAHTTAADCATCHVRQAAEWRRSVMAHAVKSPLFNALESLIEEQIGRDDDCPGGAGIMRRVGPGACRARATGLTLTGSAGEHWCVNCHAPAENLALSVPPWDGRTSAATKSRSPVRELLGDRALEGISCAFCHEVHGPVSGRGGRGYQGNPTWTSFLTGAVFQTRPEDARGVLGISNSGYELRPEDFLLGRGALPVAADGADPIVHRTAPASSRGYLDSSEHCGACHDVRLFGTDVLGAVKGEHFKRLRNAYTEWTLWAAAEQRAGRTAATCQGCHMSLFPGVCEDDGDLAARAADPECPAGTHFVARAPGALPTGRVAVASAASSDVVTHYFSGVDLPLAEEFGDALIDEPTVDLHGVPLSARRRRDALLRHTFKFGIGSAQRLGGRLEIPIEIENTGAGHRAPAGFSQERELWVHLTVKDGDGRLLYEVGRVERPDEDLRDKVFERVSTRPDALDSRGRPEGLFGADVRDGPDVPQWEPPPALGGSSFRGKGLVNFQNGFLRCVRCIGAIDASGRCQPLPGQEARRADRFVDGDYDLDTGECRSNLSGPSALFETYFPVGALDATRGLPKAPDAIIDTRSVPPGVPIRYIYELATQGRRGPFHVEARLLFRSFPPFLVKAFAAYEREQARLGQRQGGPLVTSEMLRRLEIVELARAAEEVP